MVTVAFDQSKYSQPFAKCDGYKMRLGLLLMILKLLWLHSV